MVDALNQLEELTKNLVDNIGMSDYVHLSEFVDIREQYMKECAQFLAESGEAEQHQDQIGRILKYDPLILERMHELMEEASQWLQKTRQAKQQQNVYELHFFNESVFYDQKK